MYNCNIMLEGMMNNIKNANKIIQNLLDRSVPYKK